MNEEPEIKEIDLIKIKVIKTKHIEGLRNNDQIHWLHYTFLGYITEWDAILLQHNETKHLAVGQVVKYAEYLEEATKLEDYEIEEGAKQLGFNVIYKQASESAHSLPQLFLD